MTSLKYCYVIQNQRNGLLYPDDINRGEINDIRRYVTLSELLCLNKHQDTVNLAKNGSFIAKFLQKREEMLKSTKPTVVGNESPTVSILCSGLQLGKITLFRLTIEDYKGV